MPLPCHRSPRSMMTTVMVQAARPASGWTPTHAPAFNFRGTCDFGTEEMRTSTFHSPFVPRMSGVVPDSAGRQDRREGQALAVQPGDTLRALTPGSRRAHDHRDEEDLRGEAR